MKLLLVTGTFPPRKYGGVTRMSYVIAKKMVERGHEITVFTTDVGNSPCSRLNVQDTDSINGIQVYYFRNISNVLAFKHRVLSPLGMIPALRRNIQKYDILHINGLRNFYDGAIIYYAKKYNVPYILQAHGSLPRLMTKRRLKLVYDILFGYKLLKGASKVIALSHLEAKQYKNMGVPKEKIVIIPNGIDLSAYDDLPPRGSFKKKFDIPKNRKVILYLGRFHKTKGIDLLVKAYAYLIKDMKCNNTLLVMAGPDDGYLCEVKSLATSLNVSASILFTGFISSEDKLKALVDADVFVTPSFYGLPMTFLEACATGTPIITTNLGDILEWINNNIGYVTAPSPHELAKAIHRIISDDKLYKRFSRNCMDVVKSKFLLEKTVTQLEKIYKEAIESKVS